MEKCGGPHRAGLLFCSFRKGRRVSLVVKRMEGPLCRQCFREGDCLFQWGVTAGELAILASGSTKTDKHIFILKKHINSATETPAELLTEA